MYDSALQHSPNLLFKDPTENCVQCRLSQRDNSHPVPFELPPDPTAPYLLAVGLGPGREEVQRGRPFIGPSGQLLRTTLTTTWARVARIPLLTATNQVTHLVGYANSIRCQPPKHQPTPQDLRACTPVLQELLRQYPPRAILALGEYAIKGLFPKAPQKFWSAKISSLRSRIIPLHIGDRTIPVVPTYHPSYILRSGENKSFFAQDLELAFQVFLQPPELPKPPKARVEHVTLTRLLELLQQHKPRAVAFDFETVGLDPHSPQSQLYTVAIAYYHQGQLLSFAAPIANQPDAACFTQIFTYLIDNQTTLIAHNLAFELRWLLYTIANQVNPGRRDQLARRILDKISQQSHIFEDTQLLEYIRCEFAPLSLKALGTVYFGLEDWSVDVANVARLPLNKVLTYNALDSAYTLALYQAQLAFLQNDSRLNKSLDRVYRQILIPATLRFQALVFPGVPFNPQTSAELEDKFSAELQASMRKIRLHLPEDLKSMNLNSVHQLRNYFYVLKRYPPIVQRGRHFEVDPKASPFEASTAVEALKILAEKHKDPVAKHLLAYRKAQKIVSTYIRGLAKHVTKTTVPQIPFALRPFGNLSTTVTGRTSFNSPNIQNFPKRELPEIRNVIEAPPGHLIAAFDQGQIEARFFAIVSGDPNYLKALHEGYDIHAFFAKMAYGVTYEGADPQEDAYVCRLIRVRSLEVLDKKTFKKYRSTAKNGFTFPCLYGAGVETIATGLSKIGRQVSPDRVRLMQQELWSRFPLLQQFVHYVHSFYEENHYLVSLYHRYRRPPISYTQRVNFIIQSSASDTVLVTGLLLSLFYFWLFFIHDDNSFILPEDDLLERRLNNIAALMIAYPWTYLAQAPSELFKAYIPFEIEISLGRRWGELEEVKTISADDLGLNTLEEALNALPEMIAEAQELSPNYDFLQI